MHSSTRFFVSRLTLLAVVCLAGCLADKTVSPGEPPNPTPSPSPAPTPTPTVHAGYFVSPTGTSSGTGSSDRPWDLKTALAGAGGKIQPGDTVWLRGGTYKGSLTATLAGTASAPIIVRQYPGERATVDGFIDAYGSYTTFWGFEIAQSNPVGTSERGIDDRGPGHRFINLVVHDVGGSGIGFWMEGVGSEVYGCIVYNNGVHENLDHGIYAINRDGTKHITDNVVFNNQAYGIHVYGESGQALRNVDIEGNASFNNGSISNVNEAKPNLLIGGQGIVAAGMTVTANVFHYSRPVSEINLRLGRAGNDNLDIAVRDNYASGGDPVVELQPWSTVTMTGNTFIGSRSIVSLADASLAGYTWSGNAHYRDQAASAWSYTGTSYSFSNWRQATGLAASDVVPASAATGVRVVVRPNRYEKGRAHIIVHNWASQSTVAADVSSVLTTGEHYEVRSVQAVFGAPVTSGTYGGGAIQIPMTAVSPPQPVGRSTPTPPVTGPLFDVFLLTRVDP
jgi:parallel beta helix pectate lyase-like protein